jgi:hypothetical protein
MANESPRSLLEKTQKLIELERLLTISLEKVEPWLTANTTSSSFASRTTGMRVRPIPTSMDQVHAILSVARNLSTRTSAPAGWNPAAPVVGFSTPNPLPHQLRGGALGALELERARTAQEDKKRKLAWEESQRMAAKQKQEQKEAESKMDVDEDKTPQNDNQPQLDPKAADAAVHRANPAATARSPPRPSLQAAPVVATTMNLSDSSSDEEENDSDDSD